MAGVAGRSGRPSSQITHSPSDGSPESPRKLTERATKHFDWLVERLEAAQVGSPWKRVDGATIATLAELLADQESIADSLASKPDNDKLLRLRVQLSDRIFKFSGIVGLTPRDRQRLPAKRAVDDAGDEWD